MNIELIPVDETNREDCIRLKVTEAQSEYIATNESSLEAASENADVARPFVIYADGEPVGFTMFAFDEEYEDPDDRYWLWRFMIDEKEQGKGFGKAGRLAFPAAAFGRDCGHAFFPPLVNSCCRNRIRGGA